MQYDLIYPSDIDQIRSVPCVVAASYFEAKELIAFGVSHSAFDVQNPFVEDNEFEKAFKLWDSPFYLRKFFNDNIEYFKQEYWIGITEDEFVRDVTKSLNDIRKELINLFADHRLHAVVEPLVPEEEGLRLSQSIRVKLKQGWIHHRLAFRFYAIEIEERKCYLITGATIKVHKDMQKAPNTKIEKEKLEYALNELTENKVDTKGLFSKLLDIWKTTICHKRIWRKNSTFHHSILINFFMDKIATLKFRQLSDMEKFSV